MAGSPDKRSEIRDCANLTRIALRLSGLRSVQACQKNLVARSRYWRRLRATGRGLCCCSRRQHGPISRSAALRGSHARHLRMTLGPA
jgi:hypothetical protein